MNFSININDYVTVELTEYGINCLKNSKYKKHLLKYNFIPAKNI